MSTETETLTGSGPSLVYSNFCTYYWANCQAWRNGEKGAGGQALLYRLAAKKRDETEDLRFRARLVQRFVQRMCGEAQTNTC